MRLWHSPLGTRSSVCGVEVVGDQHRPRLDPSDLLGTLEREIAEVPLEKAPTLLGELERLKALLWIRMMHPSPNHRCHSPIEREADHLLTPEEAGRMLGVTPRWLYRHAKRLPFTRRISRKVLRFSEAGLRRWLATKKT